MAMIRESGENYLEIIAQIAREKGQVRSIEIARQLGVTRASVSKALGALRQAGMVEPSYYGVVELTEAGKQRAAAVQRRHRLLRQYLTEELGVSPETADGDACRMEHVVSEELIERVAARLAERT